MVAEITAALDEQRFASEQIALSAAKIEQISGENGVAALNTADSAGTLETSSSQLRNSINRFMI
jgi:methyl-accepting chemotaxis protein